MAYSGVPSALPTWEGFLGPVLTALLDGEEHAARDIGDEAADIAGLTPEQRLETVPSGLARYRDRAGWALSALARAGAVTRPKRGTYVINAFGRSLVDEFPDGITEKDLLQRAPDSGNGGGVPGRGSAARRSPTSSIRASRSQPAWSACARGSPRTYCNGFATSTRASSSKWYSTC